MPLYRIYNAQTSEHFYTTDCAERDSICSIGWVYEGVGWMVPLFSDLPVFRLYNPYAGDHHYTLSVIERDNLVEHEWRFEGISHYSAVDEAIPVYRQYNPNAWTGTHNFTIWPEEDQMLTGAGWHSEGVSWYAAALPVHEDGPGHQHREPSLSGRGKTRLGLFDIWSNKHGSARDVGTSHVEWGCGLCRD